MLQDTGEKLPHHTEWEAEAALAVNDQEYELESDSGFKSYFYWLLTL